MSRYFAAYKCQICGRMLRYGDPQEIPYEALGQLIVQVIKNQQFAGNPYLYQAPMYIPHMCESGNAGLAQFSGFIRQ